MIHQGWFILSYLVASWQESATPCDLGRPSWRWNHFVKFSPSDGATMQPFGVIPVGNWCFMEKSQESVANRSVILIKPQGVLGSHLPQTCLSNWDPQFFEIMLLHASSWTCTCGLMNFDMLVDSPFFAGFHDFNPLWFAQFRAIWGNCPDSIGLCGLGLVPRTGWRTLNGQRHRATALLKSPKFLIQLQWIYIYIYP